MIPVVATLGIIVKRRRTSLLKIVSQDAISTVAPSMRTTPKVAGVGVHALIPSPAQTKTKCSMVEVSYCIFVSP